MIKLSSRLMRCKFIPAIAATISALSFAQPIKASSMDIDQINGAAFMGSATTICIFYRIDLLSEFLTKSFLSSELKSRTGLQKKSVYYALTLFNMKYRKSKYKNEVCTSWLTDKAREHGVDLTNQ